MKMGISIFSWSSDCILFYDQQKIQCEKFVKYFWIFWKWLWNVRNSNMSYLVNKDFKVEIAPVCSLASSEVSCLHAEGDMECKNLCKHMKKVGQYFFPPPFFQSCPSPHSFHTLPANPWACWCPSWVQWYDYPPAWELQPFPIATSFLIQRCKHWKCLSQITISKIVRMGCKNLNGHNFTLVDKSGLKFELKWLVHK